MEKENLIRPSLLSADFLHLSQDVEEMISLGITHCHFDVMDGSFVKEVSFGQPLFRSLKKYFSDIVFDVHLMTLNPLVQAESFLSLGAEEVCFHYEAMTLGDIMKINQLKEKYPTCKIGIAISPETSVNEILTVLPLFDYVLVMSVVPGKGGQAFIEGSEKKIADLDNIRKEKNLSFFIGVDGGINERTAPLCENGGADFLVAGSYYFKAQDRKRALSSLHSKEVKE